jgi:hypothetical protein
MKFGDIETVGSHTFVCGDLEGKTPLREFLKTHRPDLAYFSFPADRGVAQSYRDDKHVDLIELLNAALQPSRDYKLLTFVECLPYPEILEVLNPAAQWECSFGAPCVIVATDLRETPMNDYPDLSGLHVNDAVKIVMDHYKPKLVLDVMAGEGSTALASQSSTSHDINPRSLETAMQRCK